MGANRNHIAIIIHAFILSKNSAIKMISEEADCTLNSSLYHIISPDNRGPVCMYIPGSLILSRRNMKIFLFHQVVVCGILNFCRNDPMVIVMRSTKIY
jgi:hypothetical protein